MQNDRVSVCNAKKNSNTPQLVQKEVVESVLTAYNQEVERQRLISLAKKTSTSSKPATDLGVYMEPAENFGKKKPEVEIEICVSKVLQKIVKETYLVTCAFCKSGVIDELRLGPLYAREGVVTHYYCMLFSAALRQQGQDEDGILGFLAEDIMKEVRRSQRLKCVYCGLVGASVGCCTKRCKSAFHYPCGKSNGANFQFFGNYETYCKDHKKQQKITIKQKDWLCPICIVKVRPDEYPIMSSCCKNSVFHRDCLQKMALSAGYFFKCPTCNSVDQFVKEMRSLGIYVPEQDASWETDNAYEDLYVQYSKCDAAKCLCRAGRDHITDKGDWLLARCRLCGGAGVHKKCASLNTVTITSWACEPCVEVEEKAKKMPKRQVPKSREVHPSSSAKIQPQPSSTSTSSTTPEEEINFRKIKITPPGAAYFPQTAAMLSKVPSHSTLPDWRNMVLLINLCKWMPTTIATNDFEPVTEANRLEDKAKVGMVKRSAKIKELTKLPKASPSCSQQTRKRVRPPSKWSKGVVSKQGRRGLREKAEETSSDECDESPKKVMKNESSSSDKPAVINSPVTINSNKFGGCKSYIIHEDKLMLVSIPIPFSYGDGCNVDSKRRKMNESCDKDDLKLGESDNQVIRARNYSMSGQPLTVMKATKRDECNVDIKRLQMNVTSEGDVAAAGSPKSDLKLDECGKDTARLHINLSSNKSQVPKSLVGEITRTEEFHVDIKKQKVSSENGVAEESSAKEDCKAFVKCGLDNNSIPNQSYVATQDNYIEVADKYASEMSKTHDSTSIREVSTCDFAPYRHKQLATPSKTTNKNLEEWNKYRQIEASNSEEVSDVEVLSVVKISQDGKKIRMNEAEVPTLDHSIDLDRKCEYYSQARESASQQNKMRKNENSYQPEKITAIEMYGVKVQPGDNDGMSQHFLEVDSDKSVEASEKEEAAEDDDSGVGWKLYKNDNLVCN